jgi:hypothetical protein
MSNLVHPYRLSKQLDLIHNLARIFGVFFRQELAETETLVCLGDSVFW